MNYEGIFIIDPDLSPEASKKTITAVSEAITKENGTISNLQEWGRKTLGHPTRKKRDGVYVVIDFASGPDTIERLRGTFRLNEDILKFFITRKDSTRVKKIKMRVRRPKSLIPDVPMDG